MANDLISGPARDSETGEQRPTLWKRFVADVVSSRVMRWLMHQPMAIGITLIVLAGVVVPQVPEFLAWVAGWPNAIGVWLGDAWGWLVAVPKGATIPNGESLRNLSLSFGAPVAVVALWLAWRRTRDATRQVQTQIRQADSTEIGKYQDRFQSALKMLEIEQENIQLAGIALLDRMRTEKPAMFDEIVTELFCDMVSDKLKTDGFPVHRLHEAELNAGFNPKVNARIANLLLEDRLRREPGRNSVREISRARIAEIGISEPVGALDGSIWSLEFKDCHIERLDIHARANQKFKFSRCWIERLVLEFDDERVDKPIGFSGCVIDQIEVFGPPGEAFSEVNFAGQIELAGCMLSNGDRLTAAQIISADELEIGQSKIVSKSRDWKFKLPGAK